MSTLKNDRYLRALLREPVDCTPVWLMRQAGRYLPEYKATRAQAGDFMSLCRNAELACEVTLQPLRRYDLDAAILFSDILTVPDAMGLGLSFGAGEGPKFARPIDSLSAVQNLPIPDPEVELQYVMNAVRTIRRELKGDVPLIGFSGSPWTLATYMVEGGSSKAFTKIKKMMYAEPQTLHLLLDKVAEAVILYLNAQIKAGAQSVMIFDTWGGVLAHRDYLDFSLQYMHKIVDGLIRENDGRKVPVTLFTKGGGLWLEQIANTGCDAVGLDWTVNLADAKAQVGHKVALQGNMDPSVLYASPERIEQEVRSILSDFGTGSGHVFNLGHGIHQDVPVESPKAFVDAIHHYSAPYHK
ncbi:uroporphyrinogen decarboxylase [Pasteurellaceae bacterium Pebbles2]|nr:uroporphyrinogen decarboxylase [Pasteurellaceae bacterium Pebbles2]